MKELTPYKTSSVRSHIMSKIGGKNTKPEILLRKALFANGYRYRLHNKNLPGSPDIVLKKYCAVIFVNGCFWHGHTNCINYRPAKNNVEFWKTKIENTKRRDSLNAEKLRDLNWNAYSFFILINIYSRNGINNWSRIVNF